MPLASPAVALLADLRIEDGSVLLEGRDLTHVSDAEMLGMRGGEIGMIFQNPTSHLDPVMRIGDQIAEGIRYHQGLDARAARAAAIEILSQVGFPDPARQYDSYPHEFSGGMRQRAMIGVALSCNPEILIADEPTTALDVTIQAQILQLADRTADARGLSIISPSHDLGSIVAQPVDRSGHSQLEASSRPEAADCGHAPAERPTRSSSLPSATCRCRMALLRNEAPHRRRRRR